MESVPRRRARGNYDLWLCQFARGGAWRLEFGACEMDDYNESIEGIEAKFASFINVKKG
jgi:hypothetical protein